MVAVLQFSHLSADMLVPGWGWESWSTDPERSVGSDVIWQKEKSSLFA